MAKVLTAVCLVRKICTLNLFLFVRCLLLLLLLCVCVGGGVGSLTCGVVLSVFTTLANIFVRKRKLVALLFLYCGCLCSVFLPRGGIGLQSVIVAFPGHTHLLLNLWPIFPGSIYRSCSCQDQHRKPQPKQPVSNWSILYA